MIEDPFTVIRELSSQRSRSDWAWRDEVMNLKAAGWSLRTIAEVAGVSHDTIWKIR